MRQKFVFSCAVVAALHASSALADVTINGFATFALGIADNDGLYLGYGEDLDAQPDSVVGVQMNYAVNDKMDATVQFLARGSESWAPKAEWAYLSYHTDSGSTIRAGKLRLPFYMYSDFLDVSYAQPFLRPPSSIYTLVPLFDSYTGVDALIPIVFSNSTLTIQPFYGGVDDEKNGTEFKLSNILGANASWEWQNLQLRVIHATGDFTDSNVAELKGNSASFSGLGGKYDAENWFVTAEYATTTVDGIINDTKAGYLAFGYRLGAWTPYLSVGMSETSDNDEREPLIAQLSGAIAGLNAGVITPDDVGMTIAQAQGSLNRLSQFNYERKEYSIGTRWDFMPNVALKMDVTRYDDFNGSGGFDSDYYQTAQSDVTIASIAVDAVF